MADPIIYRFEAILNYPKVEEKVNQNGESYQQFSSQLIVDKENAPKLKKLFKDAKEAFPKAKQTINDLRDSEKEVLGDTFIKRVGCSTRLDWCKIQDLYGADLKGDQLKSGDKVYIQIMAKASSYQGKSFLVLRPQLITLLKPQAYELFDAQKELEKKNEEYFDDVKKYQQDDSIQTDENKENDNPMKEDFDEDTPW